MNDGKLRGSTEIDPQNAAAYSNLGVPIGILCHLSEARASFKVRQVIDPQVADTLSALRVFLVSRNHFSEALTRVKAASKIDPQNAASY